MRVYMGAKCNFFSPCKKKRGVDLASLVKNTIEVLTFFVMILDFKHFDSKLRA